MSKKSLLYIVGAVLLVVSALWTVYGGLFIQACRYREMFTVLKQLLRDDWYLSSYYYVENVGTMDWLQFAVMLIAAAVLSAKAFLKDAIPDIALVGLFGGLAFFAFINVAGQFLDLFRVEGAARNYLYWVNLLTMGLEFVALAAMTAILFMKDKFGQFFFAPAAVIIFNNLIWFAIRVLRLFGVAPIAFGRCFLIFLVGSCYAVALFAVAMANKEE